MKNTMGDKKNPSVHSLIMSKHFWNNSSICVNLVWAYESPWWVTMEQEKRIRHGVTYELTWNVCIWLFSLCIPFKLLQVTLVILIYIMYVPFDLWDTVEMYKAYKAMVCLWHTDWLCHFQGGWSGINKIKIDIKRCTQQYRIESKLS